MDASPLSKLPPELRNMVYHEVLRREDPIVLFFNQWDDLEEISEVRLWNDVYRWKDTLRGRSKKIECTRNMMSLTATCKALRQETRDLFFAVNSFTIEVTDLEGEFPRFSKDTASDPVELFLKHISTSSAISAVKSITLDLGSAYVWPEHPSPLHDMITGLSNGFLKTYPGLPLKAKAHCGVSKGPESLDVYIEMRNLASSIESALERLKRWHQEELKNRSSSRDREICQDEFDIITSQLKVCLVQTAMDEEV
ncbi:hypothetical protein KC343_g11842 [Hortaea werneckii]|nr:hypothetical protein KC352_g18573 [Hortaea werneckii]KAI7558808.1 hypothetical protein KC317_g10773 [Hortaea werneckii]KAI7610694.1 hypothetical protein KC343_g11842 [Hortaea werneckii]KAI7612043.1 hypothetical protein KC346_g8017 [Hortaea werneckii]KAI7654356.1 hypothetical protein KC319_g10286 [Hortaea werneckii]